MADYKVRIRTNSGQFRECIVRDFVYSSDAEQAALSQTGGGKVWSVSPYFEEEEAPPSERTYSPYQSYNRGWDTSDWYDDDGELNLKGNVVHYSIVSTIPTFILFFVHPFAAIVWNIAFSKWWFGWKFWGE